MARFQLPPNASSSSSSKATSPSPSDNDLKSNRDTQQKLQQQEDSELKLYNTTEEQLPSPTQIFLRPSEYHRHPRRTLPDNQRHHPFARPRPEDDIDVDTDTDSIRSLVPNLYEHSDGNTKHEDSDDFAVGLGSTSDNDDSVQSEAGGKHTGSKEWAYSRGTIQTQYQEIRLHHHQTRDTQHQGHEKYKTATTENRYCYPHGNEDPQLRSHSYKTICWVLNFLHLHGTTKSRRNIGSPHHVEVDFCTSDVVY
jgi:hypothetical protein